MSQNPQHVSPLFKKETRLFRYLRRSESGILIAQLTRMFGKLAILGFCMVLISCGQGGSENAMRAVISGQEIESKAQNSTCFSAGPGGGPYSGGISSPLTCQMSFRTQGIFTDALTFTVYDVYTIYQNFIGQWISIDDGLISASLRLQGQEIPIFDGLFAFDQISDASGGPVCGQYEMRVGAGTDGLVTGTFCMRVRTGWY